MSEPTQKPVDSIPEIDPSEIEFNEKIGEGSYGQVFSGICRGKIVAIKVFKPGMFQTEEERNAIRDEVRIMSKIYHPNVVLFMGACTVEDSLMIVTEKMPTDLETLIIDEKKPLSLFQRIKMAKDAALGMNWLHSSNPIFIHRDLKLSNLLVDNNYKVCVCDFGLAQMKPKDQTNMEYDPHGSPLYMAPEVFVGDYNEKCDIYSFAIVLWEIYTESQAFEDIEDDLAAFIHAVCDNNFRPEIPRDCLPRIRRLLEDCWQKDPAVRPSFSTIIRRLDEILVDACISDKVGHKLWETSFLGKDFVLWEDFCEYLGHSLSVDYDESDIRWKCLQAVLAQSSSDLLAKSKIVNITRFGQVCAWFGPLKQGGSLELFINLTNILKEKWFHGDLTQHEAEDRLSDQSKGTFLIRFSSSAPGCFTISHLNKSKALCHQRVTHVPGKGFFFWDDQYDTLRDLIKEQRKKHYFLAPCPGSSYQKLFPKKSRRGHNPPPEQGGAYMERPS
eukprot:CAMPEP_0117019868 /NCGR_PEP_ID=MMETSP0472-20121206/15180_1 /TAXON_ID=693140 ORGANISM="Tiarina fusus, Strain LIS" /NCGR_SAMPLE_ID=MMETSP0472 /ASSEMBLY_ACC=CAM_ASM_000603 /LENGTH=499 /DNA_ID=CAMNT_0004724931 /DNA_START=1 /DNA_END=1500 /DNA_ORIENTATION=-